MIAPQVVLVQRLQPLAHGNHAGTGGVESNGRDGVSGSAGALQHLAGGCGQRVHLLEVRLGGQNSGLRGGGAAGKRRMRCRWVPSLFAIHQGNANAEGAEVDAGDDSHEEKYLQ